MSALTKTYAQNVADLECAGLTPKQFRACKRPCRWLHPFVGLGMNGKAEARAIPLCNKHKRHYMKTMDARADEFVKMEV